MLKPLPHHDKRTAYIEISKSGFKFIGVLVDGDLRHSACMYDSLAKVKKFAANNNLDLQYKIVIMLAALVGALSVFYFKGLLKFADYLFDKSKQKSSEAKS